MAVVHSKPFEEGTPAFVPIEYSVEDIRKSVPPSCFQRSALRSFLYMLRNVFVFCALGFAASKLDSCSKSLGRSSGVTDAGIKFIKICGWIAYWWFQSLTLTGFWILGHECIHRSFSSSALLCEVVGFILHTITWAPHCAHQIAHVRHHSGRAHMEREEIFVPPTRPLDYAEGNSSTSPTDSIVEYLEDTPLYTLWMLLVQQTIGYPGYVLFNCTGQPARTMGTSQLNPYSQPFKHRFYGVIVSDLAILAMLCIIRKSVKVFGFLIVVKFYGVPWIGLNHWLALITYLQHTGPEVPFYRGKAWNLARGALSTIDRPFLGWQGRFFLFNIAHCHVAHHLFPQIPWYHLPEATEHLKEFLGDHYVYSDEALLRGLWRTYNSCRFVDAEGDVVFYRNKKGKAEMVCTS
ncbi:hypothetical protein SISSUDRAFT_1059182 [Sistotremastrum suecicum HHB10207 ss-3]|uniref:Fatty acid desaturase domain-containing protein n=1 Tax=Sistotremastrum suecicum HHB10207 ss-3 TaxID=1314776 RepID=A0A166GG28_9AGAM|nr:hypothetical protein SISSUDRAFT_1059182 [Sistotremastrum suecicum HHB10207 ss-3]